jgi:hypothetical protein
VSKVTLLAWRRSWRGVCWTMSSSSEKTALESPLYCGELNRPLLTSDDFVGDARPSDGDDLDGEEKDDCVGSLAGEVFEGLRMGILVGPFVLLSSRLPCMPLPPYALPWTTVLSGRPAASGRSSGWTKVGSYSCFCSRANMLLFLTRDCFLRFSIELRLGESGVLASESFSDVSKRLLGDVVCSFQKRRGLCVNGDESRYGELSLASWIF